jgi:hypothetical protein
MHARRAQYSCVVRVSVFLLVSRSTCRQALPPSQLHWCAAACIPLYTWHGGRCTSTAFGDQTSAFVSLAGKQLLHDVPAHAAQLACCKLC